MSRKHRKNNIPKEPKSIVDVVIPVYRRFDLLWKCLTALPEAMNDVPYKLYMVDNGSPKEEADEFYRQFQYPITIIRNRENLGFIKASNMAAKRGSSPLIFFLNSDVILEPNSIPKLVKEFEEPKVGICGMKLVFPPETTSANLNPNIRPANKIQHVGVMANIRGDFFHIFVGWDADHPKPNAMRTPDAVTGAAMMVRRNLFAKMGYFNEIYGHGCLDGNSYIFTADGLKTLHSLLGNSSNTVAGERGVDVSSYFYVNGICDTKRLTLEKKFELIGTPDHKVRVMSASGNIEWKELQDLSINDFVAVRYGANMFGLEHLDSSDAYLLGAYIANGSNERCGRITISSGHDWVGNFLISQYGFKQSRKYHYRRGGKELYSWLAKYIDMNWRALTKEIPPIILQADKETQRAFLSGLFDGDGCAIKDGRVTYSSSSLKLIKQLQLMLLNFGCVTGYSTRRSVLSKHLNYLLDFGSDSLKFYQEIGFLIPEKQERQNLVRPDKTPLIPFQKVWCEELYKQLPEGKYKEFGSIINSPSKHLRRETIERLVTYAEKYAYKNSTIKYLCDKLKDVISFEYVWLKVKSVEDYKSIMTYDLHIPKTHAYVANGIVVHNTFEDIEACMMAKELGYNVIVNTSACGIHYTGATAEFYKIPYALGYNRMTFLQRWGNKMEYHEFESW